tara:strand:+ start:565 stop:1029 length:465 start_codon:yes stop_codon:yes gene_type:complete
MEKVPKLKETLQQMKKSRPDLYANNPKQRAQHQMTLGSLIKALQRERVGLLVKIDEDHYPGMPHSYYGHPSDLAFEPSTSPINIAGFLSVCETSIRASFVGPDHAEDYYRDYIMQANTPVWISGTDIASKNGIVDLVPTDGYIKLVTKIIEEEA